MRFRLLITLAALLLVTSPLPKAQAAGASIFFSPTSGTFQVGSTFDVSVVINNGNNAINAVESKITFPKDKLHVVSPSIGKSFISVWTVSAKIFKH